MREIDDLKRQISDMDRDHQAIFQAMLEAFRMVTAGIRHMQSVMNEIHAAAHRPLEPSIIQETLQEISTALKSPPPPARAPDWKPLVWLALHKEDGTEQTAADLPSYERVPYNADGARMGPFATEFTAYYVSLWTRQEGGVCISDPPLSTISWS